MENNKLTLKKARAIREKNIEVLEQIRDTGADALRIQAIYSLEKMITPVLENDVDEASVVVSPAIEIMSKAIKR